ncbi:hypothetical protein L596_027203 [Steinernema carpocapsae]|uniref:Uncharacterized protein n=1 Tax=Steinernema carpocapsae TaxID=34508 RepID=A0A4U5M4S0_STECR|nr:hypothetical protein L596_027203 [Steinernema carpocapsae]
MSDGNRNLSHIPLGSILFLLFMFDRPLLKLTLTGNLNPSEFLDELALRLRRFPRIFADRVSPMLCEMIFTDEVVDCRVITVLDEFTPNKNARSIVFNV